MLVVFQYNNGKKSQMQQRYADILQRLKRGTYRPIEPEKPAIAEVSEAEEIATLRAELDSHGIEYHHRAGVAKLRELLGK